MASSFADTYATAELPPDEIFSAANLDSFLAMTSAGAEPFLAQAKETGVPGLEAHIRDVFNESGGYAPPWLRATSEIQRAINDPADYARTRLQILARNYTYGTLTQFGTGYAHYAAEAPQQLQEIQNLGKYLISNNYMAPADINAAVGAAANSAGQEMARQHAASQGSSFKDALAFLAPIVLGFAIPGLGASLGAALAPTVSAATQAALGAGLLSGAMAEATGGDFLKGAIAGGLGSIAGSVTNPAISKAFGGGVPGNIVANAITSGAIAEATGKDFIDGALAGATSAGLAGLAKEVPGFNDLDKRAQNAIISSATSFATTGQISEAQLMRALSAAVASTAKSGQAPNPDDFEKGFFEPGGEGYGLDMTTDSLGETPSNQDILDAIGYAPEEPSDTPEMLVTAPRTEAEPDWSGYADLGRDELETLYATIPEFGVDIPEMVVTAPRPDAEPEVGIPEMVVTAPRPDAEPEVDIPEMVVTAPRPEPEVDIPEMVVTAPRPESTSPPVAAKPPAVTPTAVKPSAVAPPNRENELQALMSAIGGSPAAVPTTTIDPIYGEMGPYLDVGSPLDFGFFEPRNQKQDATKRQQTTKIAAGGYIDDLLAGDMTVDDLLNLLR